MQFNILASFLFGVLLLECIYSTGGNMKKLVALCLCAIWLTSCAPSEQTIQTAIAQTQIAKPPSTYTPIQPADTSTDIPVEIVTTVPKEFIVSALLKNGFVASYNCFLNTSAGVFENGIAYDVYCETNWVTIVLVGYDGSLVFESAGYKAPKPNERINQVITEVFGDDVYGWVKDNYLLAQGGSKKDIWGIIT
jgi:hypothetical protein